MRAGPHRGGPRPRRFALAAAAALLSLAAAFAALPWKLFKEDFSFVLDDRDGRLLGATIASDGQWRFPPSGPVPPKFEKALLRFEDKRFYRHLGVDFLALGRAARLNAERGRVVSGGSTITMQAARLGLRNARRGFLEKAEEAAVALKLEAVYSKKDILRLFATNAPFGGNVVGLEAAAWRFFGRPARDLDWAESATLAVLPNSPTLITLDRNRELLRAKRDSLLRRLAAAGELDADTLGLSIAEPLPPAPFPIPQLAPHALQALKAGAFGSVPGHEARSSLVRDYQVRGGQIVADHMASLAANGIRNAALIVIDNRRGEVLCYVGNSPDAPSDRGGYVDLVRRPRSTGSLLKPFLYAAMLDEGMLLPSMLVPDVPTNYPGFTPENASKNFRGAVPAYMALARSLNVPAIRMLRDYSVDRFCALLKGLGMTTLFRKAEDYGLPLIIGGSEGTLWELSGMYSALSRNAVDAAAPVFPPTLFPAAGARADGKPGFSRGAAYLTLDALLEVLRPGADEYWEEYGSSRKIAWKTGTSQGYRDAWGIGVTPDYTVGVWVGNADGEPRPELGGTAAAGPILFAAFEMLPPTGWFEKPSDGLRTVEVCAKSGYPPGPHCAERSRSAAPVAARALEPCPYCITAHLDSSGRFRTLASLEGGKPIQNESWFVLPPAMEWYYRKGNADYRSLPPLKPGAESAEAASPLGLSYPRPGAEVFIPRELSGARGQMVAEAYHRDSRARIHWHLDETYLGSTVEIHQKGLSPRPGKHTLTLIDENGEMAQCAFTVLE